MIIYGRRATHLKTSQLAHVACPHCGTNGAVTASVFAQYAHIFWLPFFSVGRTGGSQCQHCKQVLKVNEMPPAVKTAYQDLTKETRIPLWNFVGLAGAAFLIAYGSYASGETAKKEEAYFINPAQGDLYEVKIDNHYTTFRVEAVSSDSLIVAWNNYGVSKPIGLSDIKKDENYAEAVSIARSEVSEMKRSNSIYHISRSPQ
ncbi:MAG TPA: hypothetical protein VK658_19560 [Chryseolinea sp.]|nr:hypothetical protein [Chryseolinea sp.]